MRNLFNFSHVNGIRLFRSIGRTLHDRNTEIFIPRLSTARDGRMHNRRLLTRVSHILRKANTHRIGLVNRDRNTLTTHCTTTVTPSYITSIASIDNPGRNSRLTSSLHVTLGPKHLPRGITGRVTALFTSFLSLLDNGRRVPRGTITTLGTLAARNINTFGSGCPRNLPGA